MHSGEPSDILLRAMCNAHKVLPKVLIGQAEERQHTSLESYTPTLAIDAELTLTSMERTNSSLVLEHQAQNCSSSTSRAMQIQCYS